ncbi:erythromycin esterase family protein [Actinoallomurus iriomotensis]|uniref:Uncharacterized protein n=1 Tax=Actinoallomurus iriomotensis TaxID=478107 RepID=A0A9W6VWS9_9ACTN|nr:erythromycin esterase family protein [Actinoallomurus iriomotensis]GLY82554.1 hypothetical protein Airi02_004860 [Actinoallomurus iriomotensis]
MTRPGPLSCQNFSAAGARSAGPVETTVAGLGESTRFARETFDVRDQLFRRLVQRHGFRALALQDDAAVAARLDTYVTVGEGRAESALDGAWRPWRTAQLATTLEWIRAFNQKHPAGPAVRPPCPRRVRGDPIVARPRP